MGTDTRTIKKFSHYEKKDDQYTQIFEALNDGKNIVIGFCENGDLQKLEDILKQKYPDKSMVVIHGKMSEKASRPG